jgi:hypothetical protein
MLPVPDGRGHRRGPHAERHRQFISDVTWGRWITCSFDALRSGDEPLAVAASSRGPAVVVTTPQEISLRRAQIHPVLRKVGLEVPGWRKHERLHLSPFRQRPNCSAGRGRLLPKPLS